jgi:nanoRNase/pAp phosphatase (c-di-AMP/oligoRNAs hydrolase)
MPDNEAAYRLVTRSDFDGLVCAMLLRGRGLIDDILFVHPKDMQDGRVEITGREITTNLPYVPGCHLAFDHHASEVERTPGQRCDNHIIDASAPSTARVVYNYYGGAAAFPGVGEDLLEAVDRCDAARFTEDDILNPRGWVLLNFLMDPRTGLGRFKSFRISNYELMMQLIEACRSHPIERILEMPDVRERVELYSEHVAAAVQQIKRCASVHDELVVLDLRDEETIYACNRFLVYALYPESSVSMHILWGRNRQNTVFAVGRSILKKTSRLDVGELMLRYDGGGHAGAGTCQVSNDRAVCVMRELIDCITTGEREAVGI